MRKHIGLLVGSGEGLEPTESSHLSGVSGPTQLPSSTTPSQSPASVPLSPRESRDVLCVADAGEDMPLVSGISAAASCLNLAVEAVVILLEVSVARAFGEQSVQGGTGESEFRGAVEPA